MSDRQWYENPSLILQVKALADLRDRMREENLYEGKLRKIRPDQGEPLPEWATPVFVADQDAKGLLGRLVCAYGVVNAAMELPTFPSADPQRAFDMAAGKRHHTVVDAIWGIAQQVRGRVGPPVRGRY